MLALTYHGSHDVRVDTVPDPILQEPETSFSKLLLPRFAARTYICIEAKSPNSKMGIFWAMNLWEWWLMLDRK